MDGREKAARKSEVRWVGGKFGCQRTEGVQSDGEIDVGCTHELKGGDQQRSTIVYICTCTLMGGGIGKGISLPSLGGR